MKRNYSLIFAVFFSIFNLSSQNSTDYANTITLEELKDKLYTYSSDEFEGRETGKEGQKIAVEYLKNHYINNGIESLISDSYFQNVPLKNTKSPDVNMAVNNKNFTIYDDFISLSSNGENLNLNVKNVVFVNFGINDSLYNDYKGLKVKNKIVIAIKGEPKDMEGNFIINKENKESKWSKRGQFTIKKEEAMKNGARAFFYVDESMLKRYSGWYKGRADNPGRLALDVDDENSDIHGFLIGDKLAKEILKENISSTVSKKIKSKISISLEIHEEKVNSENVAAVIKGEEFPDEYIIITAHLDHVGMSDGEIYNGADDDGSGTVAIMEIAEAFQQAVKEGYRPKRSVVFLHMTGEEKGLLGSKYYTNHDPLVPLENTVTNLNIDMIGRIDPNREEKNRNYIYLIGSDIISQDLHDVSEQTAKKHSNIVLDYRYNDPKLKVYESGRYIENNYYYRSDHYNFAQNNIPIIFYFSGTHVDYHKPTDTADKIEYDLLQERTKLIFHTAWELANRDERIKNK